MAYKIYTMYVKQYSLQYSKKDGKISISIPSNGDVFDPNDGISDEFQDVLKNIGWSHKAISNLQDYLCDGVWKGGLKMNPKTGTMS